MVQLFCWASHWLHCVSVHHGWLYFTELVTMHMTGWWCKDWQCPLLAPSVRGPQMVCVCVRLCVCVCVWLCVYECECVCVYGMNLKYALRWHIHISVHSMLCQCYTQAHTHTHPQTIWGQRTDGAKSGHCLKIVLLYTGRRLCDWQLHQAYTYCWSRHHLLHSADPQGERSWRSSWTVPWNRQSHQGKHFVLGCNFCWNWSSGLAECRKWSSFCCVCLLCISINFWFFCTSPLKSGDPFWGYIVTCDIILSNPSLEGMPSV